MVGGRALGWGVLAEAGVGGAATVVGEALLVAAVWDSAFYTGSFLGALVEESINCFKDPC